jgi:hypothetical protein
MHRKLPQGNTCQSVGGQSESRQEKEEVLPPIEIDECVGADQVKYLPVRRCQQCILGAIRLAVTASIIY